MKTAGMYSYHCGLDGF